PASGLARLRMPAPLPAVYAGDEVEVAGQLFAPPGVSNPGGSDQAAIWRDQRVRALLVVRKSSTAVTRLERGWPRALVSWRAWVRGWCHEQLERALPHEQAPVAQALLLGETA